MLRIICITGLICAVLTFAACGDISGQDGQANQNKDTSETVSSTEIEKSQKSEDVLHEQDVSKPQNNSSMEEVKGPADSSVKKEENIPFEEFVSSLPNNDLTSIKAAIDKCKTGLGDNTSENDAVIRKFIEFYYSVIDNVNPIEEGMREYKEGELLACGVRKGLSESGEFYSESPDFLYENFSSYVSEGLKEYLRIKRDEAKQTNTYLLEDAALSISWDELADRVLVWEEFLRKFPQSPEAQKAESKIKFYLWVYTASVLDNTPVFIYQNKSLNPEVKASYEKIIAKDTDSRFRNIVKEYYEILKKNKFVLSKEAIEYLKSKSIDVEWLERGYKEL